MFDIKIVDYKNKDFIELCQKLEEEHVNVIKEQRSPKGNCLNNLDKFKYVFIAYDEGKAVGCFAMKDVVDGVAELGRLYVLPDYRHNGIAYKLLEKAEKQAKEEGANKIILDTYNRFVSAVKLYKRFGFKEIDNYMDGSPYSVCMEKEI